MGVQLTYFRPPGKFLARAETTTSQYATWRLFFRKSFEFTMAPSWIPSSVSRSFGIANGLLDRCWPLPVGGYA